MILDKAQNPIRFENGPLSPFGVLMIIGIPAICGFSIF
jgi:hypothetical protein